MSRWAFRRGLSSLPLVACTLVAAALAAAETAKPPQLQRQKSSTLQSQKATPVVTTAPEQKRLPSGFKAKRVPFPHEKFPANQTPADGGEASLNTITPAECVNVGDRAIAGGVNLGTSELEFGYALGIQVNDGTWSKIEVAKNDWLPKSITFVVPAAAGPEYGFVLGIIYESEFYGQLFVMNCAASGDGGGGDSGYDPAVPEESGPPPVVGPKGARLLGPGGIEVSIALPPVAAVATGEQPQPTGKPAIGGRLLAMKALAKRGLRKVNRECDLYAPHCPCCREDNSVCLEKESDNEGGTSTWLVRWRAGAKTADGRGAFTARSAEDDLEAVTALACDPVDGATAGQAGVVRLNCR